MLSGYFPIQNFLGDTVYVPIYDRIYDDARDDEELQIEIESVDVLELPHVE